MFLRFGEIAGVSAQSAADEHHSVKTILHGKELIKSVFGVGIYFSQ